ncbi:intercellular adhesion molecule 2 isoform X2 [Perognathus longimembris pacificus]|uniref:intercellular adhesion molecule 2 isoform X2 n=1 Tax=Perognathus longimembris pacificus TaxID=214514 RepID=UPI0020193A86|nr:intercellular adhesion molecule 2 isoform X2 [Perognathus longimembris pacificus]
MSLFGFWSLLTALLILLCCPGSGEQEFEVYMWPEKLAVEMRGSMEVNCSTSCPEPDKKGLETALEKTVIEDHQQWQQFLISNVSQDTVLYCYFICAGKQQSKNASVSVYQRPTQVTLKLTPSRVVVGKPFTIECRAPAVKPLQSLTLTLLHGKEVLQNQTFGGAVPTSQEAATTFNSTAQREDGLLNFSCRAELDLRSLGGSLFHSISEPQTLEVYEPVQDNQMVIVITVVSVLLFLFVTSVLLCFVLGQHLHQRRTGTYGVLAAWRRLPRAFRAHPV